jgi:hypothetical protein
MDMDYLVEMMRAAAWQREQEQQERPAVVSVAAPATPAPSRAPSPDQSNDCDWVPIVIEKIISSKTAAFTDALQLVSSKQTPVQRCSAAVGCDSSAILLMYDALQCCLNHRRMIPKARHVNACCSTTTMFTAAVPSSCQLPRFAMPAAQHSHAPKHFNCLKVRMPDLTNVLLRVHVAAVQVKAHAGVSAASRCLMMPMLDYQVDANGTISSFYMHQGMTTHERFTQLRAGPTSQLYSELNRAAFHLMAGVKDLQKQVGYGQHTLLFPAQLSTAQHSAGLSACMHAWLSSGMPSISRTMGWLTEGLAVLGQHEVVQELMLSTSAGKPSMRRTAHDDSQHASSTFPASLSHPELLRVSHGFV